MAITGPTDLGTAAVDQATNAVLTTSTAVAAGSCIIVTSVQATATLPASCTDSAGNTYVREAVAQAGSSFSLALYVAYNVTALPSGGTITVTPGRADVSTAMGASAWANVATSSALEDTASTGAVGMTGADANAGAVTVSVPDALVFGLFGTTVTTETISPTSPFTMLHNGLDSVTTFPRSLYSMYAIVSAVGDYTAAGTLSSSVTWGGCAVALKGLPLPTVTVRPSSTIAAGGWTVGAGTLHGALSDQADGTVATGIGA